MAATKKLTAPQRRALELIATGQVARLHSFGGRKLYPISHDIRDATMDRLFAARYVRYDEDGGPDGSGRARGTYRLTDAGRAALGLDATPTTPQEG
jgi:DNA-binding PadR family transcriptional regulator